MSELRIRRALTLLLLLCGGALLASSCTRPEPLGGRCYVTDDCLTRMNFSGHGTTCIQGFCQCPDVNDDVCCPDGGTNCERALISCRPQGVCDAGDASSAASGGDAAPPPECTTDSECNGPPDPRCGAARCVEGRCELDVLAGEPINNQTPGDCKQIVCSIEGDLWRSIRRRPERATPQAPTRAAACRARRPTRDRPGQPRRRCNRTRRRRACAAPHRGPRHSQRRRRGAIQRN